MVVQGGGAVSHERGIPVLRPSGVNLRHALPQEDARLFECSPLLLKLTEVPLLP